MKSLLEKIDSRYGSKSGRGHGDPPLSVITVTATALNTAYCTVFYLLNIIVIIYHLSGGVKYLLELADMGKSDNPLATLFALIIGILVILAVLLLLLLLLIALASSLPAIFAIVFTRYRVALPAFIFNWIAFALIFIISLALGVMTEELQESPLFIGSLTGWTIINLVFMIGLTVAAVVRWIIYRRGR